MSTHERCPFCGGDADPRTICPKAVPCPRCKAGPGQRCERPSGHPAAELHAERVAIAEAGELVTGTHELTALPQIDIFGAEQEWRAPADERPPVRVEQPRLFEPQHEGQLTLADIPESGAEAPER